MALVTASRVCGSSVGGSVIWPALDVSPVAGPSVDGSVDWPLGVSSLGVWSLVVSSVASPFVVPSVAPEGPGVVESVERGPSDSGDMDDSVGKADVIVSDCVVVSELGVVASGSLVVGVMLPP